jgi:hypothetical protein
MGWTFVFSTVDTEEFPDLLQRRSLVNAGLAISTLVVVRGDILLQKRLNSKLHFLLHFKECSR